MADISKVTLPNGSTYDIKDVTARNQITSEAATRKATDDRIKLSIDELKLNLTGAMHYMGVTTTPLTDGTSITHLSTDSTPERRLFAIKINGEDYVPQAGDTVIYQNKEFVATYKYSDNATTLTWNEFGSTGSLKALAFKDSASGTVTPSGTVSTPTFTGTAGNVSVAYNDAIGDVTIGSVVASYNPSSGYTLNESSNKHSSNIFLTTHVSGGEITTNPTTATIKQVSAVGTLPTFSATVTDETLSFNFNAGSLPTTTNTSVITGVTSTLINPTVEVSPFNVSLELAQGDEVLNGTFTPQGTISQLTFTGNASIVTVK